MHLTWLRPQAVRGGLEHHAHRGGERPQREHLVVAHDARVHVREQTGLLQNEGRHLLHIVQRRGVPAFFEPGPGIRPAFLRAVAEGEESLLAAHRGALSRDSHDLLGRHVQGLSLLRELAGGVDEDAVMASITAQVRDRQEHLFRERDDTGPTRTLEAVVPKATGDLEESLDLVAAALEEQFGIIHRHERARRRAPKRVDHAAAGGDPRNRHGLLSVGRGDIKDSGD